VPTGLFCHRATVADHYSQKPAQAPGANVPVSAISAQAGVDFVDGVDRVDRGALGTAPAPPQGSFPGIVPRKRAGNGSLVHRSGAPRGTAGGSAARESARIPTQRRARSEWHAKCILNAP